MFLRSSTPDIREVRHFHLFSGIGGGARGFNRGSARLNNMIAKYRCIGGVDVDPAAIRDFGRLAGVPGTVLDLFSREQYIAYHGHEPPPGWREATIADIHAAAGFQRPHIVFLSSPCQGLSALLSETKSKTAKYQALNQLTVRGVFLTLEAFRDDPSEFILFENVPRIASRGRGLLDQINGLLAAYGYVSVETTHDCGELGGLAQSRKRFLLVARHKAKIPPYLYEPPKRRLRAIGEILGDMPLPGDPAAGPMHRIPKLEFQTWVRLAFIEAGQDWRSLTSLHVENGQLQHFGLHPTTDWHRGILGVNKWSESCGTVPGRSRPGCGAFSVADPRFFESETSKGGTQYGLLKCDPTATRVTVADTLHGSITRPPATYDIVRLINPDTPGLPLNDPRSLTTYAGSGKYRVSSWAEPSGTVIAASTTGNGAFAVADPRIGGANTTSEVTRINKLPKPSDRSVTIIKSLDGTWHRPFSAFECAALQSLVDPLETLELDGLSDEAWRKRIGNAVPSDAAQAIADTMGHTLLLAWSGTTFMLSNMPIWVQQIAVALSLHQPIEH
jgi:site-specific DNA-cytosine methylase